MSEQVKKVNENQLQIQELKGALAELKENDIADVILNRVNQMNNTGALQFPPNYSVANALKSANLILQKTVDKNKQPVLKSCTKQSIALTLLNMVVQGLNPGKTQCYFVAYGTELQLMRSYFGEQSVVKNADARVKDIYARVIFNGDELEIDTDERGHEYVKTHKTVLENRDKGIRGAYSVINVDGYLDYEIMTWAEIQKAWSKSKNPSRDVHNDFGQEMSKKTVIRRHCKRYINTSNDSNLYVVESYNNTTKDEYINDEANDTKELALQVEEKANKEVLTIDIEENQTEKAPF